MEARVAEESEVSSWQREECVRLSGPLGVTGGEFIVIEPSSSLSGLDIAAMFVLNIDHDKERGHNVHIYRLLTKIVRTLNSAGLSTSG